MKYDFAAHLIHIGSWQSRNPPVNEVSLEQFLAECPYRLPEDYADLMRCANGGEGDLSIFPGWFQLWPVEEALKWNDGYKVAEFYPGYFAFGGSGGHELLAFKVDGTDDQGVFALPLDSGPEDIMRVAKDLRMFANAMGDPTESPWIDTARADSTPK